MSFNCAVNTNDLIVLISDRRGAVLPNNYTDSDDKKFILQNFIVDDVKKYFKINRNTFCLGLGWDNFFRPWMKSFKLFHGLLSMEVMAPLGDFLNFRYCEFLQSSNAKVLPPKTLVKHG